MSDIITIKALNAFVEKMLADEPGARQRECEFYEKLSLELAKVPEDQRRAARIGLLLNSPALDDVPVGVRQRAYKKWCEEK